MRDNRIRKGFSMKASIRWLSVVACLLLALPGGGCKKKPVPQAEPAHTASSNLQTQASPAPLVVTQQVAVASARASAKAISSPVAAPTEDGAAATEAAAGSQRIAGAAGRFEAQLGSTLRMEGTSTVHDWFAEGRTIAGFFEVDSAFQLSALQPGKIKAKAEASIPVRTLKSSSGPPMDKIMYQYMKLPQYPKIEYRLTELTLKAASASAGAPQCDATGQLAVCGVTNVITMPVTFESSEPGKLRVKGAINLKMTDFGITPPVLTVVVPIKTGNEVKVSFEWLLALKTEAP